MQIARRWLAIGAIALIGSMWFVSRVLLVMNRPLAESRSTQPRMVMWSPFSMWIAAALPA